MNCRKKYTQKHDKIKDFYIKKEQESLKNLPINKGKQGANEN